jgi:hypothetical protein
MVNQSVTLSGMASSDLPVSYKVVSGQAALSGDDDNVATFTGSGLVVLEADQSGNDAYSAAPAARQMVSVQQAPAIASAANTSFNLGFANSFTITTTGFPAPAITETGPLPLGVTFVDNGDGTATLAGTPALGDATSSLTLTANNGVGTPASQDFTITMAPTGYGQWGNQHFTSSQLTDPTFTASTATPFGDGFPNLLKYLFDIDPSQTMTAPERAALPVFNVSSTTGNLTLTFREYTAATGVTIQAQTSSDLQNWTTLTQSPTLSSTTFTMQQVGTDLITMDPMMQVSVQPTGAPRQFIRISVSQQ